MLSIPSLNLECAHSSMGGRFTTVEGMLQEVKNQLEKSNPFVGDSATNTKLKHFLEQLSEVHMCMSLTECYGAHIIRVCALYFSKHVLYKTEWCKHTITVCRLLFTFVVSIVSTRTGHR